MITIHDVDLRRDLKRDEGVRLKPYIDTVGKVTIGCGRNIQDVGISDEEMELMLTNDIKRAIRELDEKLPWWKDMNEARQRVMANMCFNMGIKTLLTFKNSLRYIEKRDYLEAARNMRLSKWYRQVGARAERLCETMETGHE